jgi:hypothetical protein
LGSFSVVIRKDHLVGYVHSMNGLSGSGLRALGLSHLWRVPWLWWDLSPRDKRCSIWVPLDNRVVRHPSNGIIHPELEMEPDLWTWYLLDGFQQEYVRSRAEEPDLVHEQFMIPRYLGQLEPFVDIIHFILTWIYCYQIIHFYYRLMYVFHHLNFFDSWIILPKSMPGSFVSVRTRWCILF